MTSARSVILYLCVSLAALAALALSAAAATANGSTAFRAEPSSASNSEFLSSQSLNFAFKPAVNASAAALSHAHAGRLLCVPPAGEAAANVSYQIQNTPKNVGLAEIDAVSSEQRHEKRGTGSL
jgi:hypothetical protein